MGCGLAILMMLVVVLAVPSNILAQSDTVPITLENASQIELLAEARLPEAMCPLGAYVLGGESNLWIATEPDCSESLSLEEFDLSTMQLLRTIEGIGAEV